MKRLALCLLLAAAIAPTGCAFLPNSVRARIPGVREDRSVSPARYRDTAMRTLAEVEAALGMELDGRIRVVVIDGTDVLRGFPTRVNPNTGNLAGGWVDGRTAIVLRNPETGELPAGLRSPLAHELAHVVLRSNGVPREEHHAIMRRAGILETW